jgi:hypothetical protein
MSLRQNGQVVKIFPNRFNSVVSFIYIFLNMDTDSYSATQKIRVEALDAFSYLKKKRWDLHPFLIFFGILPYNGYFPTDLYVTLKVFEGGGGTICIFFHTNHLGLSR